MRFLSGDEDFSFFGGEDLVDFGKLKEKVGKKNFLKNEKTDGFGGEEDGGGGGGEKERDVERSSVEVEIVVRRMIFSFRD